ncbi:MAG: hypothetical protein M3N51_00480 [Actinomycetota bacterium]|nr:hypothetical protein [Actinomycetota bacterium]
MPVELARSYAQINKLVAAQRNKATQRGGRLDLPTALVWLVGLALLLLPLALAARPLLSGAGSDFAGQAVADPVEAPAPSPLDTMSVPTQPPASPPSTHVRGDEPPASPSEVPGEQPQAPTQPEPPLTAAPIEQVEVDVAVVESYVNALVQGDYDSALAASSGAARTYIEYLRVLDRVAAESSDPSASVSWMEQPERQSVLDDGRVAVDGFAEVSYQDRSFSFVLSDFVLAPDGARWVVDSYKRDGFQIDQLLWGGGESVEAKDVHVSISFVFVQPPLDDPQTIVVAYRVENHRVSPLEVFPYGALFSWSGSEEEQEVQFLTDSLDVPTGGSAEDVMVMEAPGPGEEGRILGEIRDPETEEVWTVELTLPPPG